MKCPKCKTRWLRDSFSLNGFKPTCSQCGHVFSEAESEIYELIESAQINGCNLSIGDGLRNFRVLIYGPHNAINVIKEKLCVDTPIEHKSNNDFLIIGDYETEQEALKIYNNIKLSLVGM